MGFASKEVEVLYFLSCLNGLLSLFREILNKFGRGLLTVHEQLTVSRYFGDYKVNITNNTQERSYDKGLWRLSKRLSNLFELISGLTYLI